jgi:hypothetical protein
MVGPVSAFRSGPLKAGTRGAQPMAVRWPLWQISHMPDPQSLGIELPSPAYVAGLVVFGIVGYVAWRRGRKTHRSSMTWVGVATMLYPYLVPQTWLLWLIGIAATAWIWRHWS